MKLNHFLIAFLLTKYPSLMYGEIKSITSVAVTANSEINDKLVNDIFDHISFHNLLKKGFTRTGTKLSSKIVKVMNRSEKAEFFLDKNKEILLNSDFYSNDIFNKDFILLGKTKDYFKKHYGLNTHKDKLFVSDTESFIQITLFFKDNKLIHINTVSRID